MSITLLKVIAATALLVSCSVASGQGLLDRLKERVDAIGDEIKEVVETNDVSEATLQSGERSAQGPSSNPVPGSENAWTRERHSGFDVFGIQLGMTVDEAVEAIHGRLPEIYTPPRVRPIDISEQVALQRREQEVYRSEGKVLNYKRAACVDQNLPRDHCVYELTIQDYATVTPVYLQVFLTEDVKSQAGTTVVHKVVFAQSSERIDAFDAVTSKYGEPDADNEQVTVQQGRRFRTVTSDYQLQPDERIVGDTLPATEWYWYVASPLGDGTVAFCESQLRAEICESQAGYGLVLTLDGEELASLLAARDAALKKSVPTGLPF